MDVQKIIEEYYRPETKLYDIYMKHGDKVREKALKIAESVVDLNPDLKFIEEASMLHDIGIFLTHAPGIFCFGDFPYVCHGFKGFEILNGIGYKKHGLVCERHTLMGIKREDIIKRNLPLPERDMMPVSIEEKIICYADNFFSKTGSGEKSHDEIESQLGKYGEDQVIMFNKMRHFFNDERS